jgi:hypothetical protein
MVDLSAIEAKDREETQNSRQNRRIGKQLERQREAQT